MPSARTEIGTASRELVQPGARRPVVPTSWLHRFGFRFLALYLVIYNLPFPLGAVTWTGWAEYGYDKFWQAVVRWVSVQVLQLPQAVTGSRYYSGTSDALFQWVNNWCILVLAFAGGIIWACFDQRRRRDPLVRAVVRVYVRYVLGATMLLYGLNKLLHLQMDFPGLERLIQPYGEITPKGLLWDFMGYSAAYSAFTGLAEIVGGLLLFFRRTTSLGALVISAVMANVVMLNLCFDIAVKRPAMHLLFFGLVLLAPDLRRLANVFIFNRPSDPLSLVRAYPSRRLEHVAIALKVIVLGWMVYAISADQIAEFGTRRRPELFGAYEVEVFSRDGEVISPSSASRWRTIVIGEGGRTTIFYMDGRRVRHWLKAAPGATTLKLSRRPETPIELTYSRPTTGELRLHGKVDGAQLSMILRRIDESRFPLMNQPFHWVQERVIPLSVPVRP